MYRLRTLNVPVLTSKELITRLERTGKLRKVGRQMLICFVKCVTDKRLIAIAPVVIDPALRKVLVDRLVEKKFIGRKIADHV